LLQPATKAATIATTRLVIIISFRATKGPWGMFGNEKAWNMALILPLTLEGSIANQGVFQR
jgi:hypothetical protein